MTEKTMVDRFIFVVVMTLLVIWCAIEARSDVVELERLRPSKVYRQALVSGVPPAELCSDDRRDIGRAVMVIESEVVCVCFGEAKGWICR